MEGNKGERYSYRVDGTNDLLKKFKNYYSSEPNINDGYYNLIAESLLKAEMVKSGERRNERIKKGMLFIRKIDKTLVLLKLEEVSSIDEETFEFSNSYTVDSRYYKGIIFKGNLNDVTVIDKQGKAANYWSSDFLGLERNRDDKRNTNILVEMITKNNIFKSEIEEERREYLYNRFINFIRFSPIFSYDGFLDFAQIMNESIDELFETQFVDKIDSSFNLDNVEKQKLFKVKLKVTENLVISDEDLSDSVKKRKLRYNNGEIIIKVDKSYQHDIQQQIERFREQE